LCRIRALRRLHLPPINLVFSKEAQTKPYLGDGFALRCFQRLSVLYLATQRCPWQDNWYTRGTSFPILSY